MSSQPYFSNTNPASQDLCLLCNNLIKKKDKTQEIKGTAIENLNEIAEEWSNVLLPIDDAYIQFKYVKSRIESSCAGDKCFRIHKGCRPTFRNRIRDKTLKYGVCDDSTINELYTNDDVTESPDGLLASPPLLTRSQLTSSKQVCFICNEVTSGDNKIYNDGGLARCSQASTRYKLEQCLAKTVAAEDNATNRLRVLVNATPFEDIHAADVLYHKRCYSNYIKRTLHRKDKNLNDSEKEERKAAVDRVVIQFMDVFERRVIIEEDAFLMTEIFEDLRDMSQENGFDEPVISQCHHLKSELIKRFGEYIDFKLVGRNQIVYSQNSDPSLYAISTLKGAGLRDADLTKAFAKMVRRKLNTKKVDSWPISADELIQKLDSNGPSDVIYNAVAWSLNPNSTINAFGYVKTKSNLQATKLWGICSDWESLVTKERSPKSIAFGLTLHRLTGSKEAVKIANKCGNSISYSDVKLLNSSWSQHVTRNSRSKVPPEFIKGKSIHISIDNSDGKQHTSTGSNTTHYTNGIIFQNIDKKHDIDLPEKEEEMQYLHPEEDIRDYGTYKIPAKKTSPPPAPEFEDNNDVDLLQYCLKRDMVWALLSSLKIEPLSEENEIEPIGSWTCFMKSVTDAKTYKCKLDYLEVVPHPPNDNICKWYLDEILKICEELQLDNVFLHADEAVFAKIMIVKWLHGKKYDKITSLLGGFHTLNVNLKILYKKYALLGMKDWWIDADAIAMGSADQCAEGRHYSRSIRLHKQSYEALMRHRIEEFDLSSTMDEKLKRKILNLRRQTSPENLNKVIEMDEFDGIYMKLLETTGTQSQMMVQYMCDVSVLLALVSSVREHDIRRHMQAERALLPKLFAFGHPNYSRYLTYQHVMLQLLEKNNPEVWDSLIEEGFGASRTGNSFSAIHGDLMIETTINREVKVRGGPMQGGYSTNIDSMNKFVKTSHLMAKVRSAFNEKLHQLTTSVHKETTPGSKRRHERVVMRLLEALRNLMNPFLPEMDARNMKTGEILDKQIVAGLLNSDQTGEKCLSKFIRERIKEKGANRVSFFAPIKNPKIDTGLKKDKKPATKLNILKEEKQAFGLLIGKLNSSEEALQYPLTSIPLSLATPDGNLRQSSKASLRNHIMHDSNSIVEDGAYSNATWIIDGMAAVRSITPKKKNTWADYANSLLSFITPSESLIPTSVVLVMDTYGTGRIKSNTQAKRGMSARKIVITSSNQLTPTGKDWESFLCNGENKTELIRFLSEYYRSDKIYPFLRNTLVITENELTWEIDQQGFTTLPSCNHHEADTRVIWHAVNSQNPVVVVANDTDILVLLVYAYATKDLSSQWKMKVDTNRFIDIPTIVDFYGREVCMALPAYHSMTGCDTTSFPYNVGKIKPFNKMISRNTHATLTTLGSSVTSVENINEAIDFYHTVMYSGQKGDPISVTRSKKFEKLKEKTSQSLIADIESVKQHIRRADLQCFTWRQCCERNINHVSPIGRGWRQVGDELQPIWYIGPQLPPALTRGLDYQADRSEESEPDCHLEPKRRKRKRGGNNQRRLNFTTKVRRESTKSSSSPEQSTTSEDSVSLHYSSERSDSDSDTDGCTTDFYDLEL